MFIRCSMGVDSIHYIFSYIIVMEQRGGFAVKLSQNG